MTHQLPSFMREMLAAPPLAGEGVHRWLFCTSRQLHAHLPANEIVALLESCVANCGRHVPRSEIVEAVQNSMPCAWRRNGVGQSTSGTYSKWPRVNQEQHEAIVNSGGGLADLWELSRPRIGTSNSHTEEIIDQLFPGNPLLCCGRSNNCFDTKPRESWRGELFALQLIVPSPMSARLGRKKNPKPGEREWSAHTLDNTSERRFLICEFDAGTTDEHAALLIHLAGYAPLVCAVHSGGKSLHGWFFVHGQAEGEVLRFFQYAVSLGADPATWTPSQFVRMPDGTRDNGRPQTVYFVNVKPLEAQQ